MANILRVYKKADDGSFTEIDIAEGSDGQAIVTDGAGGWAWGDVVTYTGTETLTNKTIDGVTPTVMGYVDPTSSIQTQLNGKQATLTGLTSTVAELNVLDGITATVTELNYVDGVTSAIQTQLGLLAPIASPTFTGIATFGGTLIVGTNGGFYDMGTGIDMVPSAYKLFRVVNTAKNSVKFQVQESNGQTVINGGLHIGANSEVGTNNLVVDGALNVAGAVTFTTDLPIASGGTGASTLAGASIVTYTGTETLTNKTLTSPKINENVALTSTATELNLLDGITVLSGANTGDNAANTSIVATKLDDFATPDNNTDLNANTTNHGLLLKATAPAAGLYNYLGITNGETAYTNKALFDATAPTTQAFGDAAAVGTAAVSARRDHKHAMMATPTKSVQIQILTNTVYVDTASGIGYFYIPASMNGWVLTRATAMVTTAGTTNATTIQVRNLTKYASNDALSTAISIASGGTVATAGTVNASYDDVSTDDRIKIYVTANSTTPAKGLYVILEWSIA